MKAFRPIVVVDGPRYLSPTSALKDPGCCGKRGCPGHWLNIDTDRAREIEKERKRGRERESKEEKDEEKTAKEKHEEKQKEEERKLEEDKGKKTTPNKSERD